MGRTRSIEANKESSRDSGEQARDEDVRRTRENDEGKRGQEGNRG